MKPINTMFITLLITVIILSVAIILIPEELPSEQTGVQQNVQMGVYLTGKSDQSKRNSFSLEDDDYWNWYLYSRSRWKDNSYSEDTSGKIAYERMYFLFPEGKRMTVEDEIALDQMRIYEK
jgi:hypothetical protein